MVKKYHIAKHIHANDVKAEQSFCFQANTMDPQDARNMSASAKWIAIHKDGSGGPVFIWDLNNPHRVSKEEHLLSTHGGKVLDSEWSPFDDDMIATASEDCKVHINKIPEEGMAAPIKDPLVELVGHEKKVQHVAWNPTASGCVLSASDDRSVKLWNVETSQCVESRTFEGKIKSAVWNNSGSLCAVAWQAKGVALQIDVYDPRQGDIAWSLSGDIGTRSCHLFFSDAQNLVGISTLNKKKQSIIKMYDQSTQELQSAYLDKNMSVCQRVYYDDSIKLLCAFGKGTSAVTFLNLDGKLHAKPLVSDRSNKQIKGACFVPKRSLDTEMVETIRFMKLTKSQATGEDRVEPLRYCIPRKAAGYHAECYPPVYAGKACGNFAEWASNPEWQPIYGSMNPDSEDWVGYRADVVFEKKATYDELVAENAQLKARIAELEAQA